MLRTCLFSFVLLLIFGSTNFLYAATINSGTIINYSYSIATSLPASNLINQSGLSIGYTSGSTDFDSYAALNPTHLGTSYYEGYLAPAPAYVDFDFGKTFNFTDFGLWNDNDYQGVNNFSLLVSDNASFSGATLLGSFQAFYGPTNYQKPVVLQTFDLNDAVGQYVRLTFTDAHSDYWVNVGEVIFGTNSDAPPVPEPATLLLLGSGLAGLAFYRRKRK